MEQTLKLTGIFPVGETIEHYSAKPTKQEKREAKKLAKQEARFAEIRNQIIENTLGMANTEIQQNKAFADHYKNLSEKDKIRALKGNAVAAEKAKGKNATNAILTALSWTLTLVTSTVAPGLTWIPLSISAATTAKTLSDAYKARKGLSSDAILKGGDYSNAFEDFYNKSYLPMVKIINNDKDMLLEKQKTMSKKEFKEYMEKYCTAITEFQTQNKGEE